MLKKIFRLMGQAIDMLGVKFISLFYKNNAKYKDIWLISERGTEAKDNGYWMYKYIRENHPEINVHYIIDKSYKNDYEKVKKFSNIIEFKSLEHKIAFILSNRVISTHIGYVEPWSYKLYKMILDRTNKKKYIFLQHGVIYNDLSEYLNKSTTKIDKFITSTIGEYNSIANTKEYGYYDGEVVQTGLARFDNLHNNKPKNQILLMPTWRKDITNPSYSKDKGIDDSIFLNSKYYSVYSSLLNSEKLKNILIENNIKLIFYPHYEIQQYVKYFNVNNDYIVIAKKEEYDVQQLLMDSNLLVTDYSSVFFDFAYMKKPIIHYCFDKLNHYKTGYFDLEKDGFGKIISEEDELINQISQYIENKFSIEPNYEEKINDSFTVRDNKNCERIYDVIKNI